MSPLTSHFSKVLSGSSTPLCAYGYNLWLYFLFFSVVEQNISVLFLRLQNEKWMNVKVGDIIKLENNQFVAVSIHYCMTPSQIRIIHTEVFAFANLVNLG